MKKESTVEVGPIDVDDLSSDEIVKEIIRTTENARTIFHVNAHALNLSFKNKLFCGKMNEADICFCDGFGVKILSALFSDKMLKNRNTPPDFIEKLYFQIHSEGKKVYFLGDTPEVVARYARHINGEYEGIVSGYHHGFFEENSDDEKEIIQKINDLRPDVLIVGMGMPKQELWSSARKSMLSVTSIFTVGALFAWCADPCRKRGPKWATDVGLEWFFRLLFEFKKVWFRYLVGLPEVFLRMLLSKRSKNN